jgi:hypothetical protein
MSPPPGLELPPGFTDDIYEEAERIGLIHEEAKRIAGKVGDWVTVAVQEKADNAMRQTELDIERMDKHQEEVQKSLEGLVNQCRNKVTALESDQASLQSSIAMLEAHFNALSSQFSQRGTTLNQPSASPSLDTLAGSPLNTGNLVNASMRSPFMTFPSGFPPVPDFPVAEAAVPVHDGNVAKSNEILASAAAFAPSGAAPARIATTAAMPDCLPIATNPVAKATSEQPCVPKESKSNGEQTTHSQALEMLKNFKDCEPDTEPGLVSPDHPSLSPMRRSPMQQSPASSRHLLSPGAKHQMSPNSKLASPKRTPRSYGKLPMGMRSPNLNLMKSPGVPPSPFVICESGGSVFGFTLRVADDCFLGITTETSGSEDVLTVVTVSPGSAMDSWNKACEGGPSAGKSVMPGDKIMKVNDATTPWEMLMEFEYKKLLRFTVAHGNAEDAELD